MTVKQVITELQKYPDDMEVHVCSRACAEDYAIAQSVTLKTLAIYNDFDEEDEEEGKEDPSIIDAVVIDEQ